MLSRNLLRMWRALCCVVALTAIVGNAAAELPFENDGNLYVAMYNSDTYNVFGKDGQYVTTFTTPGLNGPRGLAFNPFNGDIWVTGEFSNTIYVFNSSHQFLWALTHPEFNQPVGVSFKMTSGVNPEDQEVYISNSGNSPTSTGNNIMVFDQQGNFLRSFTRNGLVDPNCTAFFPDGSFYVSNRLGTVDDNGNSDGILGRVDKFDENDNFLFSFNTPGMASVMAVARDPNGPGDADDTVWVTSGSGARCICEFDQDGNLLQTILPSDLPDFGVPGSSMVPQGIAFDDNGNMTVVSWTGGVYLFDGDGNLQNSYDPDPSLPAAAGKSRSMAFAYEVPVATFVAPNSYSVFRGFEVTGSLTDFESSDDIVARFNPGFTISNTEAPVWLVFDASVNDATDFQIESQSGTPGLEFTVEAFHWSDGAYEVIGVQSESFNSDSVFNFPLSLADHVDGNGNVRSRVGWRTVGFTINFPWEVRIDQVGWNQ